MSNGLLASPIISGAAPGAGADIFAKDLLVGHGAGKVTAQVKLAVASVLDLVIRSKDGVKATGSIIAIAGASLIDTETFVLNDGSNPALTFEFDSGGGITGDVAVVFTGGDTAQVVRDAIIAAINGAAPLNIVAAPDPDDVTKVILTHSLIGTVGNVVITETVADVGFVVAGMAGGIGAVVVVPLNAGVAVGSTFLEEVSFFINNQETYNLRLQTNGAIPYLAMILNPEG